MNPSNTHRPTMPPARALMPLLMAAALSACAIPHDPGNTQASLAADRIEIPAELLAGNGEWPEPQWWRRYGAPQLDALIDAGLKQAPSLAVARARLKLSHEQARLTEASEGLAVGLQADVDRQSVSQNGFLGVFGSTNPMFGTTGPWYTAGTLGLGAEYTVDVWGRNRARVEAAMGMTQARQAELRQTELLLSAQIAQVYIDLQGLLAEQALIVQSQEIAAASVRHHQARARQGLEMQAAAAASIAREQEFQRMRVANEAAVKQAKERLRELCGMGPQGMPALAARPLVNPSADLPPHLGFELLARRPDLQAMQASVRASMSQIDAAKAAFYPSFDIKAFFGYDALHLEDLLKQSSRQLNLVPGLSLPIFDNGRLNANLAGVRAQNQVLMAQYNELVLRCVREVADVSVQIEGLRQQQRAQADKLAALRSQSDAADAQQHQGLIDKTSADDARLPWLQEQARAVALQTAQWRAHVSLITALGGGYQAPGGSTASATTHVASAAHGESGH